MSDEPEIKSLRGHLFRTRVIAWGVIVVLGVAVYLLIQGKGTLPGVGPVVAPPVWEASEPYAMRSLVLEERNAAMGRGDLEEAAGINGQLAHEAVSRAKAVLDAWMTLRHPTTGLFPESPDKDEWNYRNVAADCFGFLIHAAMYTGDTAALDKLRETVRLETALALDPDIDLCQPVEYDTADHISEDHDELLFASSEYLKDGLLSVHERWDDPQVLARLTQVLDNILSQSDEDSQFGKLPSTRSEPNGNLLQLCARLAFSHDPDGRYADLAGRLADAVIRQMLPANEGLPVHYFDFKNNVVLESKTMLRDHGNELPVGLSEAFALAVTRSNDPAWKARADRWAEPMLMMYELMLEHGVNRDGLIANTLEAKDMHITDDEPSDNWGYVACGVLLFEQAARRKGNVDTDRLDALLTRLDGIIAAVSRTDGLRWEGSFDGYADTLESAIYMSAHRPQVAGVLMSWVDDQIALMFEPQRPDGFVSKGYLDGNFIRTSLLYADQKQGGWRLEPWDPHTQVGYAEDAAGGKAVLRIRSRDGYRGRVVSDAARHTEVMKLPWDWPRLNSWPEWCHPDRLVSPRVSNPLAVSSGSVTEGYELDIAPEKSVSITFDIQ